MNIEQEKHRIGLGMKLLVNISWFYITLLIFTGFLSKLFGERSANQNFPLFIMLAITAVAYSYNFLYFLFFRGYEKRSIQAVRIVGFAKIVIDAFLMNLIIFYAGGIVSVSFIYITFVIVASGFVYRSRGIWLMIGFASALYLLIIWGQYFGFVPFLPRYNDPFEFQLSKNLAAVIPNTFTIVGTFFILGYFVRNFSNSIREKEAKLTAEKGKERAIFANLSDGLVFFGPSGRVEMANKQAEKLLGFKLADIQAKNIVQMDIGKYPALALALRAEEAAAPKPVVSPIDPEITLQLGKFDIKDDDGRFVGTALLARDVSREKFVDRMKSEFITIAGHQLRTPLSAVKGAVSLLKAGDYGPVNENQTQVLAQIGQYNERLIQLVNDFLNVSSIEQGRFEYQREAVDIADLLREVTGRYAADAQRKLIRFTTEVKNDLAPLDLDPYKIKLALGGIINNAIVYTPKRGHVEVAAEFPDPGRVVISVSDSGIGIPKDQQAKVFSKFFRADNALRVETEGNGLDLFVAKNIVETHNGKIWFKSQEGIGTTFFIELPTKV